MGKSGHIARKIAATLASTGTPAFFVHPGEASHGDLGMITQKDVVLALSNSGETDELLTILPVIKRQGIPLIAMTGNAAFLAGARSPTCTWTSACRPKPARSASRRPPAPPPRWCWATRWRSRCSKRAASPPTISRARIRPAALGRRLLLHISDVMHAGDDVPRVRADATLTEALVEMSRKRPGHDRRRRRRRPPARRLHRRRPAPRAGRRRRRPARDAASTARDDAQPKTIAGDKLAVEAAQLMEAHKIHALLVRRRRTPRGRRAEHS